MKDFEIVYSDELKARYPTASVGILIMKVSQDDVSNIDLSNFTNFTIDQLKNEYSNSSELKNEPIIQAFSNYYKVFNKTYHVLPQLESVIFKGKELNLPIPLLQIVFLMELKNLLLTAVHDFSAIMPPIKIDVCSGMETYELMNGSQKNLKSGDMFTRDKNRIISSIVYGPDSQTRISLKTSEAMIVVYAPPGINRRSVEEHFDDIFTLSQEVSIEPVLIYREVFPTIPST